MVEEKGAGQALEQALAPRVPLIVVKCGSRGAVVQHGDKQDWAAPRNVDFVGAISADDSFNAGFNTGFLSFDLYGEDPLSAAAMGNDTAAQSTLRFGVIEAFRNAELRDVFLERHTIN